MSGGTASSFDTELSGPPLSPEEFRELYVNQQRMRFRQSRNNVPSLSGSLPPQENLNVNIQNQQQQQPEFQRNALGQHGEERNVNYERIREHLAHIGEFAAKVLMATLLFFHSFSMYYVMIMVGVYIGWSCICRLLSSVRVDREDRSGDSVPSRPGAAAGDEATTEATKVGEPPRVSAIRRALYIGFRCLTSLVLSVSPTFSIEQLELELAEDGIVTPPCAPSRGDVLIRRN